MPFTLSHAVLAPPLSRLTGGRLPTAALAIGCMVPDLFRLFTAERTNVTHLWSALIHPDLWIGLAFCAAWYLLYRPAVYRFLGLQHDLGIYSAWAAFRFLGAVCAAVIAGTATHLIWDGLTHADFRTFAFKEALSQPIMLLGQAYPLHRILQIGCSIAALPLIGWMSWRYYQSYQQHLPVSLKIRRFAWGLALASLGAGALQAWLFNISPSSQLWRTDLYEITGRLLNEFAHGSLLMFSLGCLLFAVLDRGHRMG
ncbi:DUF4184 family protein [Acinetobacter sp. WCHAc010034]|uniref:DUF4184 family protein n=1 Tax=Acinetobacter sp. WCHAc010034 TaxID=1879049 RepID=UPI00083B012C|nr:DUF4184 family protein [Acinetobacter sp. WCHAc010034]AYA03776.1 DUF4184 family protein [Acinetobacter sp. WCHAc010034]